MKTKLFKIVFFLLIMSTLFVSNAFGIAYLSIFPDSINFGTTETEDEFTITFNGDVANTVYWEVISTNKPDWVTLEKYSGYLHYWTIDRDDITVWVERGGLAGGNYTGKIVLTRQYSGGTDVLDDITIYMRVVDTTPPTISNLTVNPTIAKAGTTLAITFTVSETLQGNPSVIVAGNAASFNSKSGNNYTYSYNVQGTEGGGNKSVYISATDTAGNTGSANTTVRFDFTPPDTYIDSYPPNPTNSTSATFEYSASESGCEFSYKLDGGFWSAYTTNTSKSYTNLTPESHTFYVKAKDEAGNEDLTPASYTWVIDRTPPDTSIDSYPPDPTNSTSATFEYSASESGCEFSYKRDSGFWSGYTTNTSKSYTNLPLGSHTFYVKAKDAAGNEDLTPASYTWVIDRTPPDTSIDTYPPDPTNSTSATFTFSASESGCEFSYKRDSGFWSGYTIDTSKSYTSLTPGSHTFYVKAKDTAGNEDLTPASYTWVIDRTPPDTSIDTYPPDPTNSTSATFTFSASESGCEFSYKRDSGFWSGYTIDTSKSYTSLTPGSHTFYVKAKDAAGNEDQSPDSYTWVIDRTPPDTSIDTYPPDPTNSTSATFTFSASESGCEFSYQLDGGGWSGYTTNTSKSYTNLPPGSCTFEVKAKDAAGNEDQSPASYTWVIDTAEPDTSIDTYPPDPTNSTSATFTFSASESGCEFSYKRDSGFWSGYTIDTSKSYTNLPPGSHTFYVKAKDTAGNEDLTPASYTWVIDTAEPDTSIDTYPPDPTNSTSATFTFSANKSGCEFSYQLDGGGWSGYTTNTSKSYTNLPPGSRTFEVKAKDTEGNVDSTPASYTWVIDRTPPDTSIDTYPPDPTNSTSATFTFSASESGCEFSYQLDGGGWSGYTTNTSKSYTNLPPGSYTFEVKAKDTAGNEDLTPASYTWVIDRTPPDTSIDTYPPDPTNSTSATFEYSADEIGCEFSYQLDGGGWSGYTTNTSKSYTNLPLGSRTFKVKAKDAAGNEDLTPASYTWVIVDGSDTTPPNTFIDSYPPDPTNSTSATFEYSADEIGCEFSHQLNSTGWSGYSPSTFTSYTGLTPGSHTFYVKAKDGAGNEDLTPATYTWVIDRTPPDNPTLVLRSLTTGSTSYTNSPIVGVTVGNDDDASAWLISKNQDVQPKVDNPLWGDEDDEPSTFTLSDGDGPKTVYIWVKDAAGNINPGPAVSATITLDTIPPGVTLVVDENKSTILPDREIVGVLPNAWMEAQFSKVMSTESVKGLKLIAVRNNLNKLIEEEVSLTFTWEGSTKTVITPSGLKKNYLYELKVTTTVTDLAGNSVERNGKIIFRTIMDHEDENVVAKVSEGEITNLEVHLEAKALPEDGYLIINTQPLSYQFDVDSEDIDVANEKNIAKGWYPVEGCLWEIKACKKDGDWKNGEWIEDEFRFEVKIAFPYEEDKDKKGEVKSGRMALREETLLAFWLDEEHSNWVRVPGSRVDKSTNVVITGEVPHFSVYALMGSAVYDLSDAHAYPVPWKPNDGKDETGAEQDGIIFTDLSAEGVIKIYSISGELVREYDYKPGDEGEWIWDVKTSNGEKVFSGVYIYYIKNEKEHKTGRLMIIR